MITHYSGSSTTRPCEYIAKPFMFSFIRHAKKNNTKRDCLFSFIQSNQRVTYKTMREAIGVKSDEGIKYHLDVLEKEGKIEYVMRGKQRTVKAINQPQEGK